MTKGDGLEQDPVFVPVIPSFPEVSHNPPVSRKVSGSWPLSSSQANQLHEPKAASFVPLIFANLEAMLYRWL